MSIPRLSHRFTRDKTRMNKLNRFMKQWNWKRDFHMERQVSPSPVSPLIQPFLGTAPLSQPPATVLCTCT